MNLPPLCFCCVCVGRRKVSSLAVKSLCSYNDVGMDGTIGMQKKVVGLGRKEKNEKKQGRKL